MQLCAQHVEKKMSSYLYEEYDTQFIILIYHFKITHTHNTYIDLESTCCFESHFLN